MKKIAYIDLFCGIGGFRFAFEKVAKKYNFLHKCVFSSDIDKYARETYYNNFKETPSGDITKIDEVSISPHDIIFAGFPCQAFSISGKKLGFEDARGTLFFDVARIAKKHKPKMIFLENVKNFETHDGGKTLKVIKTTLEDLGYSFFYKVLNSADYGSPQKRERIYMLAFREDLGVKEYIFPLPSTKKATLKSFICHDENIDDCIINRNDIIIYEDKIKEAEGKEIFKTHRIGIINKGGQGERIYHPNGQAITLSAYGGGAAAKTGAYLIDGKIRKLSIRECSNIMGFPKKFKPHSLKTQAYKQFGNSVVVHVLESILEDVFKKGIL